MGNTINLSETLIIALGSMAIVLAIIILYAISLVVKLSRVVLESKLENRTEQNTVQGFTSGNTFGQAPVQAIDEIDDEDRLIVALAASALTAESNPNSHFRISKITRIK